MTAERVSDEFAGASCDLCGGSGVLDGGASGCPCSDPANPASAVQAAPCEFCAGSGVEWWDYWSQDAEPCRRGCRPSALFGRSGDAS